jgi:hypothetical protein
MGRRARLAVHVPIVAAAVGVPVVVPEALWESYNRYDVDPFGAAEDVVIAVAAIAALAWVMRLIKRFDDADGFAAGNEKTGEESD